MNDLRFPLVACLAIMLTGCRPSPPEIVESPPEAKEESETQAPEAEPNDDPEAALVRKLKTTIIPKIEFAGTPLEDVVAFLVQRSRELDDSGRGIAMGFAEDLDPDRRAIQLTLDVSGIPLSEALLYIAQLADLKLSLEGDTVLLGAGSGDPAENALLFVDRAEAEAFRKKLQAVTLPVVEFRETPFVEALQFLIQRARELDIDTPENRRGVDVVLDVAPETGIDPGTLKVTLKLSDVPLGEAFRQTAAAAGLQYEIEGTMIVISAPQAP